MPVITTGSPIISGLASADLSGLHKQQQQDALFMQKLEEAKFQLQQEKDAEAQKQKMEQAREQVLPQLIPQELMGQSQPKLPVMGDPAALAASSTPPTLTAASAVESEQLHQKHVQMATQIAPLLGKLDNDTTAMVFKELHNTVARDQDQQARKATADWLDKIGAGFGDQAKGVVQGLKTALQDPRTDPDAVVKQAHELMAPKLAQEADDQLGAMLAAKAEATFSEGGKFPTDYAHGVFVQLQHGLADNKTVKENFDKIFIQGLEPVDIGTREPLWVDAKQAAAVRQNVVDARQTKVELDNALSRLREMQTEYERQKPKLEADKNASQEASREGNLKLRAQTEARRAEGQTENLKLRASGQESAKESRVETLNLGKRNADFEANKAALEAAQKDPAWGDANTQEKQDALIEKYKTKLKPKTETKESPEERARRFLSKPK